MYLVPLKALLVSALRKTFDSEYPTSDFRDTYVSIEYPVDSANYPGIWVDYDDSEPLRRAGIDHREHTMVGSLEAPPFYFLPFTRWRFIGVVSMTIVALSSRERDRLYDEVIRVLAFGNEDGATHQFRQYIENNPLIAANMDFDVIQPRGNAAAPGTPWGTDEVIYERTINVDILGEFLADRITGSLLPLSAIKLFSNQALIHDDDLIHVDDDEDGGSGGWH